MIVYPAAGNFVRENCLSKIPRIGRGYTIRFINNLYRKGAYQINVSETKTLPFAIHILEIFVSSENKNKRVIVDEILKSCPTEVIEAKKNIFRVRWAPVIV